MGHSDSEVGAAPPPWQGAAELRATPTGPRPLTHQPSRLLPPQNPSSPQVLGHPYGHLSFGPSSRLLFATRTSVPALPSGLGRSGSGHLFSQAVLLPLTPPTSDTPTARTRLLSTFPPPGPSLHRSLLFLPHLLFTIHPYLALSGRLASLLPHLLQPPSLASVGPLPLTSFPSSSSSHSAFIPTRRKHQLRSPARPPVTREPGSPIAHSALGCCQYRARLLSAQSETPTRVPAASPLSRGRHTNSTDRSNR